MIKTFQRDLPFYVSGLTIAIGFIMIFTEITGLLVPKNELLSIVIVCVGMIGHMGEKLRRLEAQVEFDGKVLRNHKHKNTGVTDNEEEHY